MLKACVVCGEPSRRARCPACSYTRPRGTKQRNQRQRVIERDNYQCQRCGKPLSGRRDTHVDHIVPLAATPGNPYRTDDQLATLCATCNLAKGAA